MLWKKTEQYYYAPDVTFRMPIRIPKQNLVFAAVQIAGGIVKVANKLDVTVDDVFMWIEDQHVDPRYTGNLAKISGMPKQFLVSAEAQDTEFERY